MLTKSTCSVIIKPYGGSMVKYNGLSKAEVLCALYNRARCVDVKILMSDDSKMTLRQARELLMSETYFDYINGRNLEVDLSGKTGFDETLYDEYNGKGAAQLALDDVKLEKIRVTYYDI